MSYGPAFTRRKTGSAFKIRDQKMPYLKYTWPYTASFNASGNPSIALPLGLSSKGLPLGIKIVGKWRSEPDLIKFTKIVSGFTETFTRPRGY